MKITQSEREALINFVDHIMAVGFGENYRSHTLSPYDWCQDNGIFDMGVSYADGATKMVFIMDTLDWVIKINYSMNQNYCAREYKNYVLAEEVGLAYYFAATDFLCEREGIEFYIQEQVECCDLYGDVDSEIYEKLRERYDSDGISYSADNLWNEVDGMDAVDRVELLYGDNKLVNFVWEHHINDLHGGNFGIVGDHYVIIDFSGFGQGALEAN